MKTGVDEAVIFAELHHNVAYKRTYNATSKSERKERGRQGAKGREKGL